MKLYNSRKIAKNWLKEYSVLVQPCFVQIESVNDINQIKESVKELNYVLINLSLRMRQISCISTYKPSRMNIPIKYKDELLRPITEREMACFELCLKQLNYGNIKEAYHELMDMFDDGGKGKFKKYISVSEAQIFSFATEQFLACFEKIKN